MAIGNNTQMVKLGEWLPDQPPLGMNGLVQAKNTYPVGNYYIPIKELTVDSDALSARCIGFHAHIDGSNGITLFAATKTKLYKYNGGAWDDVTRTSGGDYTTGDGVYWRFISYGSRIMACNGVDPLQSFVIGSSSNFADISGAPDSYSLTAINNFIVTGNTTESGTEYIDRVKWSGIDDPTSWTVSVSTQSDFQDLPDGGKVQAIVGYETGGIVFQERAITRMEYVGTPAIFNFSPISESDGTRAPYSVVADGDEVFWYGYDGFYRMRGNQILPIGEGKIDEFFQSDASLSNGDIVKIRASINPENKFVVWSYVSATGASDVPDKALVYNWAFDRWSLLELEHQLLSESYATGVTLEQLDALYGDLDSIPISLDDPSLQGGRAVYIAFNGDGKLCYFSGTNMTAVLETAEIRFNQDGRAYVSAITLDSDAASANVSLKYRDNQSGSLTTSEAVGLNSVTDQYEFGIDARYHRALINLEGSWTKASAIQVRYKNSGVI